MISEKLYQILLFKSIILKENYKIHYKRNNTIVLKQKHFYKIFKIYI